MLLKRTLSVAFFALLTACSMNDDDHQHQVSFSKDEIKGDTTQSLASAIKINANSTAIDAKLKEGLSFLDKGNYERAGVIFNIALQNKPDNSLLHFLKGFVEHMKAVSGQADGYEMAEVAYKAALNLDPANRFASRQLGHLYFEKKKYALAQEYFAYAASFEPNNVDLLKGIATSSYYAQNLSAAYKALRKAEKLKPHDKDILRLAALISAAGKKKGEAESYLRKFEQNADMQDVKRLEKRIAEWEQVHKSGSFYKTAQAMPDMAAAGAPGPMAMPKGLQMAPPAPPPPPTKMAIVDLVSLRTQESGGRRTGQNILENINAIFSGNGVTNGPMAWSRAHTKTRFIPSGSVTGSTTYAITRAISFDQIRYALNIANTINKRIEVISRPTLIALDGRKSNFFSGDEIVIGLTGIQSSSLERDRVGYHFAFTPRFLNDGRIEFDIESSRSFPERNIVDGLSTEPGNNLANNFMKAYNEIEASVVLEFGQTLILAGISEKEFQAEKTGVPFLKDIPGVQYFFASNNTVDIMKSLIIMMTPRKPGFRHGKENFQDRTDTPRRNLDRFLVAYLGDMKVEPNLKSVFAGLESNTFLREFRMGDATLEHWFHVKNRRFLILQTLDTLYF